MWNNFLNLWFNKLITLEPNNFKILLVDDEPDILEIISYTLKSEGYFVYTAENGAKAIKLAKKMGPGKTIVTILCDHGRRYASKIFNKEFLKSKNLPIPKWLWNLA